MLVVKSSVKKHTEENIGTGMVFYVSTADNPEGAGSTSHSPITKQNLERDFSVNCSFNECLFKFRQCIM